MGGTAHNKIHGAAAEMLVAHDLMKLGYGVALPLSDSEPYDLIAIRDGKLWRLQVKATAVTAQGNYRVLFCHGKRVKTRYTKKDCDFIVAVIYYPTGAGVYVIPVDKAKTAKGIFWEVGKHARYPDKRPRCKYEDYRNGWNQLA